MRWWSCAEDCSRSRHCGPTPRRPTAYERFGGHGISVFGAADHEALHELARTRVSAFEVLTLMTVGALRASGLECVPTFRRPHFTILLPDLEIGPLNLLECENETWVNSYHPRPGDRP